MFSNRVFSIIGHVAYRNTAAFAFLKVNVVDAGTHGTNEFEIGERVKDGCRNGGIREWCEHGGAGVVF